jgi:hypothetical protein
MPSTESPESTESTESTGPTRERTDVAETQEADEKGCPDRRGLAIAAVVLLACGGLIGYSFLNSPDESRPRAVPTAEVTYEVTGKGTAELSYLAHSTSGEATVEKGVTLPWKKTVQVPLGKAPSVNVVLGQEGGQASCTLAIRGKHVQRATAFGEYGRATCTGELPTPERGEG